MRITAIALGLVLGGTVPLVAQEERSGAPHEGIKVHGHWTIDVKNADGTPASHTEFENSLYPTGNGVLGRLLTRQYAIREWYIVLEGANGPCARGLNYPYQCRIAEPASVLADTFQTLTIQFVPTPGGGTGGPGTLELAGNATVAFDSDISRVWTQIMPTPGGSFGFTAATVSGVTVKPGQIVQVKVSISFS